MLGTGRCHGDNREPINRTACFARTLASNHEMRMVPRLMVPPVGLRVLGAVFLRDPKHKTKTNKNPQESKNKTQNNGDKILCVRGSQRERLGSSLSCPFRAAGPESGLHGDRHTLHWRNGGQSKGGGRYKSIFAVPMLRGW